MMEHKIKRMIDKTVEDVLNDLDIEDTVRDNMIENGLHPMKFNDDIVSNAFSEIYQEVIYQLTN